MNKPTTARAIAASTRTIGAVAVSEIGNFEEGLRASSAIASEPGATADAIADAAYLHAVCGRNSQARSLLAAVSTAGRSLGKWSRELGSRAQGYYATIALQLCEGQLPAAAAYLVHLKRLQSAGIDASSRVALVAATVAVVHRAPGAENLVRLALDAASTQNAWRWEARARILEAVVNRDAAGLAHLIAAAEERTQRWRSSSWRTPSQS